MEINDKYGSLIVAYSFPYSIVRGTCINLAWANPANGYNPGQYNGLSYVSIYNTGVIVLSNGILIKKSTALKMSSSININGDLTICAILSVSSGNLGLGGQLNGANPQFSNGCLQIAIGTGVLFRDTGGAVSVYTSSPPVNLIFSLIFIRKGTNIYTYYNGVLNYSGTRSVYTYTNDLFILNTGGNQKLYDYRIYNRAITPQEIKQYHNQFASQIVLNEDFSNYGVGQTRFGRWGGKSYSTTNTSIKEQTTPDVSKLIKIGTKFLYNNNSEVFMPSSAAYGTWQWDIMWVSAPIGFYNGIHFMANTSDTTNMNAGYSIAGSSNTSVLDTLYFQKGGVLGYGLAITIKSVATNGLLKQNIWYNFKVTRNSAGLFSVYINGSLFTTYTDTTYTTSNFFGIAKPYFTTQLANIQITQGITV